MRTMLTGSLWLAVLLTAGCPTAKSECSTAGDCAALVSGAASNAPPRAPKYCEGGACVDPPSGTSALSVDLSTPRNVAVQSIRYAVLSYKGAGTEAA